MDGYSRLIRYDEAKDIQVRLAISNFRDVDYLSLRKYYRDYEGEWAPSKEGITIPLELDSSKELFVGLLEILSLSESRQAILETFKELLDGVYQ